MEISLKHHSWMVKGFHPWVPLMNKSMETGLDLKGVTDWIPATVPGGVHYDLYRAGLIEQPYEDMNSLHCEWVENRWWLYKATFERPHSLGKKIELICKGLDYHAIIYLNGIRLGEHEGMYHPAVFDITQIVRTSESLELEILFKNAPDEVSQIGKTSSTITQKSRFNYKWDFSTRLVNVGIWDDVVLKVYEDYSIGELSIRSHVNQEYGEIDISMGVQRNSPESDSPIEDLQIQVSCFDPSGIWTVYRECLSIVDGLDVSCRIRIENPQLWYPNGYGEQPLYKLEILILKGELPLDKREISVGIRKLAYAQNEKSPTDALPYTFEINDQKIYIKGVNLVPLDHLYGNVTPSHYEWIVWMLKQANVNLVRIWGGGIIEKEVFYDLCDRNGILIWQEFIQSSSGFENIPSTHPQFLHLLRQTAISALRERRNHTALALWSGGNELMSEPNIPSTYDDDNLAMLKQLVEQYDPQRLFLPTSASGPVEFITLEKGISHDVHGQWKYLGSKEHYELYGEADNLFHSEFGVDGLSSVKSLNKFLSRAHRKPVTMNDNLVWRHHGEWWDTLSRDELFFGPLRELPVYAMCSQWIQAEGLRFILEANRRRKFQNSGSIIWQFNEPWPNVSCTCMVDYYGEGKMAYYWARKAYAPLHVSLDYRRLNYEQGEWFKERVYYHSNGGQAKVTVTAEVLDLEGTLLHHQSFHGVRIQNRALNMGKLTFEISTGFGELFFIRLKAFSEIGETESENLYTFSTRKEQLYAPALQLSGGELEIQVSDMWQEISSVAGPGGNISLVRTYRIKNVGNCAVLHVHPEETTNLYWMEAEDSFETLFPGESRTMTVRCFRKQAGGFLSLDQAPLDQFSIAQPSIIFKHFREGINSELLEVAIK